MSEPFDLQRVYAEKTGGPFTFRWADQMWELPHARMLDISVQADVETLDPTTATVDTVNNLFDKLMGAEQGTRWRDVLRPLPMLFDLLNAWMDHCRVVPGEAPASSGSSKSTGRPSKRTSAGSTKSGSRTRSTAKTATPAANSSA